MYSPGCERLSFRGQRLVAAVLIVIALAGTVPAAAAGDNPVSVKQCYGVLGVTSTPSGATVFIDGVNKGATPLSNYKISMGSHTLRVSAPMHADAVDTLTVSCDQTYTRQYTLADIPAPQYQPPVAVQFQDPAVVQFPDNGQPVAAINMTNTGVLQRVAAGVTAATPAIPTFLPTPVATLTPVPSETTPLSATPGPRPTGLPLSPVIPDRLAPLLAMLAGAGAAALAAVIDSPNGSRIRRTAEKVTTFVRNLVPWEIVGFASVTEAKRRGLAPSAGSGQCRYLLSPREWLVVAAAALGFALAFVIQNRISIELTKFLIFLCMGAFVVIFHDVGHRVMANRIGQKAEVQFWELGFCTMLVTAWLFGNAFAKPTRPILGGSPGPDARSLAIIQATGSCINLAAAGLSLLLIPLGGFYAIAGSAGFSMNLLSCVYSLIPIHPLEGKTIWDWSRAAWLILCLPLIVLYAVIYLIL